MPYERATRLAAATLVLLSCALLAAMPARAITVLPDAVGDATRNDLASVSGGFDATDLNLEAAFATPLSPSTLYLQFDLDVDLDVTTGSALSAPGADFFVFYNGGIDTTVATVAAISGGTATVVGTVPVRVTSFTAGVRVPLALLGDDGAARFGAQSGVVDPTDPGSGFFILADRVPQDAAGRYRLGGPTTPVGAPAVPEPAGAALFAAGVLAVGAALRRRRPGAARA